MAKDTQFRKDAMKLADRIKIDPKFNQLKPENQNAVLQFLNDYEGKPDAGNEPAKEEENVSG